MWVPFPMKNYILTLLAAVTVSSCQADEIQSDTDLQREHGWMLASITKEGTKITPVQSSKLTFRVQRNRITAFGGVNQYDGKVKTGGDGQFRITEGGATEIAGPQDLMKQEETYFSILSKATKFKIKDQTLILSDDTSENELQFNASVPPAPLSLLDTKWIYSGFEQEEIGGVSFTPFQSEPAPNLTLNEDGKASGSGGVNRFFGNYEVDSEKGSIKIGALGSTRKGGPPAAMKQENEYFQRLQAASGFSISGNVLRLTNTEAKNALVFEAAK